MNQNLQEHEERKRQVIAFLEKAAVHMEDVAASESASEEEKDIANGQAASIRKQIENVENNLFTIVLVGEFSVGKSSFLNALMHKKILPSFSRETTATVNFLRSKEWAPDGTEGIVYYQDGSEQRLDHLDADTLKRYVSTEGEAKGGKVADTVERVELFFDNKFLNDGVMLVDSPGLNGVTERLADITQRQIERSHASIFMFSADHPGTKTDFEALSNLKAKCHRIFTVMNKIDDIKADEGETPEKLVEQLQESYHNQFPDENLPEIYPIAAYPALLARDSSLPDRDRKGRTAEELEELSRLEVFEDRLFRYLTKGDKTRELFVSAIQSACAILEGEKKGADDMIRFLETKRSSTEINEQKEKLEDAIDQVEQQKKANNLQLNKAVCEAMSDLKNQMSGRFDHVKAQIVGEADQIDDPEELKELEANLPATLNKYCLRIFDATHDDLRSKMQDIVQMFCLEQLQNAMDALNQIPDLPVKFEAAKIEINEVTVGKNLEAMERRFNEKKAELEKIQQEIDKKDAEAMDAHREKMEVVQLKNELKDIRSSRETFEATFRPANISYHQEKQWETLSRTGLFGRGRDLLFGKKIVSKDVTVTDTREHDEDIERREKRMKSYEQQEENAKKELKEKEKAVIISEQRDREVKSLRNRMEREQKELEESQKRYREQLAKEAEKACRKLKRSISDYVEDTLHEIRTKSERQIQKQTSTYEAAVRQMAQMTLDAEMKKKETRLKELCEAAAASDKDRDEKLAQTQANVKAIDEILTEGLSLSKELELTLVDTIKEGSMA